MAWLTELIKQVGKTLRSLPRPVLIIFSSVFVIMCYWFTSIYLISPSFYKTTQLWITFIICFTLSITWFLINTLVVTALVLSFAYYLKSPFNAEAEDFLIGGLINSIIYLSIVLFICFYSKASYFIYLISCSGYIAIAMIYILYLLIKGIMQNRIKVN